ncbi:MAG: T9SS type A sorting domain-containing protein [candidate division Zixibacteria bacterium]
MSTTDANWDQIIIFGDDFSYNPYLGSQDTYYYDEVPYNFRFPAGVSGRTDDDFYVVDAYNAQIAYYKVREDANPPRIDPVSTSDNHFHLLDLNHPVDIDAGHIPHYDNLYSDCDWFDTWVAICDRGYNRIIIANYSGLPLNALGGYGAGDFKLNNPTSVAFSREHQMGWQMHDIYVADAGNNRIAKFYTKNGSDVAAYDGFIKTPSYTFPSNAYLSSVEVDNFGNVYALDHNNGKIYKFNEDLELLGEWGGIGGESTKLYYPSRISITRGWRTGNFNDCANIYLPSRYGDLLVTEVYTNSTGIKRYELENVFTSCEGGYYLREPNKLNDRLFVNWEQTDYGRMQIIFKIQPSGEGAIRTLYDETIFKDPGPHSLHCQLPEDAEMYGDYEIYIKIWKFYNRDGIQIIGDSRVISGSYDRGETNYPPFFTGVYLEGASDTCVISNEFYVCRAQVTDYDDAQLYYWWIAKNGYFQEKDEYGNPQLVDSTFTLSDSARFLVMEGAPGNPLKPRQSLAPPVDLFYVYVHDPHGASSSYGKSSEIKSSCSSGPPPPPPPECPILYWEDNGQWKLINNLMAESDYENRLTDIVSEIYPIYGVTTDNSGRLHLRVTEEAEETTTLKSLRASIALYPESMTPVFTNRQRLMFLSDNFVNPSVAYNSVGDTITDLIIGYDKSLFIDNNPGYIIIEYDFPEYKGGARKPTIEPPPGGPAEPPPDKDPTKPLYVAGSDGRIKLYEVSALDVSGNWIPVTKIYPRLVAQGNYIEMNEYIIDGKLTMKIDYHDAIEIDHMPYYFYYPANVAVYPLQVVSAHHSNSDDVAARLIDDNSPVLTVKTNEYIDMILRGPLPAEGYKQLLLVSSRGKYEKDGLDGGGDIIVFDQNYPNPFNPNTTFSFYLPEPRHVKLEIYNVLGQKVKVLADEYFPSGPTNIVWDSKNSSGGEVASGVYFARFTSGDYTSSKKIEVVR